MSVLVSSSRRPWLMASLALALAACGGVPTALDDATSSDLQTSFDTAVGSDASTATDGATATDGSIETATDVGATALGDAIFPLMGNGGYDVLRYALDLTPVHDPCQLTAVVRVESRALQPLRRFSLDFRGEWNIRAVTVDGVAAGWQRDGAKLLVDATTPVAAGATFVTEVAYDGVPVAVGTLSLAGRGARLGLVCHAAGYYSANQPDAASSWLPCNDHPSDKALFEIVVRAPQGWQGAANGLATGSVEEGDRSVWSFATRHPMATYLLTVATGDFVLDTVEGPGGVPLRSYFPRDRADDLRSGFSRLGEMLTWFAGLFTPYPLEAYGEVVTPANVGFGALETQTLSLYDISVLNRTQDDREELLVHELAHQWFGNSVTPRWWSDIWLNESLATYAEWLWREREGGERWRNRAIREAIAAEQRSTFAPGNPPPEKLFGGSVYRRGALGLHALRQQLGDEAFFELLRVFVTAHADGNVTTDDLRLLLAERHGAEAVALLDGWIYGEQLPTITL